jgi:hypothetical protein
MQGGVRVEFQVLKTIDKQMPLNFFIDTLVPLSERIKVERYYRYRCLHVKKHNV